MVVVVCFKYLSKMQRLYWGLVLASNLLELENFLLAIQKFIQTSSMSGLLICSVIMSGFICTDVSYHWR